METINVEFKGERSEPLNDKDLVAAVVCLANRLDHERGYLLVGVEDDGSITGARSRHGDSEIDPHRIEALVGSRTRPALSCRAELFTVFDKSVLVLQIPRSASPKKVDDLGDHQNTPFPLDLSIHKNRL